MAEGNWKLREVVLVAMVTFLAGLLVGYAFHGSESASPQAAGAGSSRTASAGGGAVGQPPGALPDAVQAQAAPLLATLKTDPNNAEALIELANIYYDNKSYAQAIEYYTRAAALRPNDINVHTDLGTALWYSGMPGKAVAEYEKSLAIDPSHPNTLFNLGVVRAEGLHDSAGAIAAWQHLLETHPEYPEKQRVLDLIAKAKSETK
jgi:cytochrome c-type biogenesis protein CcmH/NrfG